MRIKECHTYNFRYHDEDHIGEANKSVYPKNPSQKRKVACDHRSKLNNVKIMIRCITK